jgi:gliding motility-associated protein GldC
MKKSEIRIQVELDKDQVPERIQWDADDKDTPGFMEANAIALAIWDHVNRNTLRIDLWTKEMAVDEMKLFYIDTLGGLAQSILNSTGDEYMAGETNDLCDRLVNYLKSEMGKK